MESPAVPFGDHPWSVTVLAASACALGASSGTTARAQCPSPCSEAMIRSHRITHRRLFPLIAVFALLLSVLALSLRPAIPVSSSASAPLFQTLGFAGEALAASRSVQVKVNGTPVRLAYRLSRSQQPTLLIEPERIMPEAQVQVLWTPGQVSEAIIPSMSMQFLGQLSGASSLALSLPTEFSPDRPGQLVFQSLPLAKTLGTVDLADLSSTLFQEVS